MLFALIDTKTCIGIFSLIVQNAKKKKKNLFIFSQLHKNKRVIIIIIVMKYIWIRLSIANHGGLYEAKAK